MHLIPIDWVHIARASYLHDKGENITVFPSPLLNTPVSEDETAKINYEIRRLENERP